MIHEFEKFSVEQLITGPWKENCYIVKDRETNEAAIFDPGDDAPIIRESLGKLAGPVRHVMLTHGHYDHLLAAPEICNITSLPCTVHKDDIPLLRRAPIYAMAFEKRKIEIPDDIVGYDTSLRFKLGRHSVEILSTPGHTPGSVCLDFGDFILSGDTLLHQTIGRSDLPGGNDQSLNRSIDLLLDKSDRDAVLLPGHGKPWLIGEAQDWWNDRQSTRNDQVEEVK